MIIKIVLNNDSKDVVGFLKLRKNTKQKTKIQKIKEYISKEYDCTIKRMLPTGKIDFKTGEADINYILFGENLPFRNIRIFENINCK